MLKKKYSYQKFNKDYQLVKADNEVFLYKFLLITVSALLCIVLYTAQETHTVLQKVTMLDTMERVVLVRGPLTRIDFDRNQNIPTALNNPGCIRPGNKKVDALAIGIVDTDNGPFLAFMNPHQGFKALKIVLQGYKNHTVDALIHRYAPESENNTEKYIEKMCKITGCTRQTLVKDINPDVLCKAIAKIEGFKS